MAGTVFITYSDYTDPGNPIPCFTISGPNGYFIPDGTGKQAALYLTISGNLPANVSDLQCEWSGMIDDIVNNQGGTTSDIDTYYYATYEYTEGYGASNEALFSNQLLAGEYATDPAAEIQAAYTLISNILASDGFVTNAPLTVYVAGEEPEGEVSVLTIGGKLVLGSGGGVFAYSMPPVEGDFQIVAEGLNLALGQIACAGTNVYDVYNDTFRKWNEPGFTTISDFSGYGADIYCNGYSKTKLLIGGDEITAPGLPDETIAIAYDTTTSSFLPVTFPSELDSAQWVENIQENYFSSDGLVALSYTDSQNDSRIIIMAWDEINTTLNKLVDCASAGYYDCQTPVYDGANGHVYAVLNYETIGRWNGATWETVLEQSDGSFYALAKFGNYIYAFGESMITSCTNSLQGDALVENLSGLIKINTSTGEITSFGILDDEFEEGYYINKVIVHNNKFYVGGWFEGVDSVYSPGIIKYDPATEEWIAIASMVDSYGSSSEVYGMDIIGSDLYVMAWGTATVNGEPVLGNRNCLIKFKNVVD